MKLKKTMMILIVLSLLFVTGCCKYNVNTEESEELCSPYCLSKNMTYVQDTTLICPYTILCGCQSSPIIRSGD